MTGATAGSGRTVGVELSAVVFTLAETGRGQNPMVLTPRADGDRDIPTVAFEPGRHATLQSALRDWVGRSAGLELGYVEQLYTFGDPVRSGAAEPRQDHTVSIGYLALVGPEAAGGTDWTAWDVWFPWEDRRSAARDPRHESTLREIVSALGAWAAAGDDAWEAARRERIALLFGGGTHPWRDELTLERYELLYEADLVPEAWRDRGAQAPSDLLRLGRAASRDHRRIIATAIGRLRAKLKYRPVLFELMGEAFTLLDLQQAAEAVSGVALHKQNFRRMVERSGLIEPTGQTSSRHGGRPAALYRLAPEAMLERRATAVRFGAARPGSGRSGGA